MKRRKPEIPPDAPEGTVWFGGPIDRCSVNLHICGDALIPEEITRLLHCHPTFSQTKGVPVYDEAGQVRRIAKSGGWHLKITSEDVDEWDLEQIVLLLFTRLPSDRSLWHSLGQRFTLDLFCGLFMDSSNRGFSLSPNTCRELADRGIEIGFDIYCPH